MKKLDTQATTDAADAKYGAECQRRQNEGASGEEIMAAADARYHAANQRRWDEEDRVLWWQMLPRKITALGMLIIGLPAIFCGMIYLLIEAVIWIDR